MSPAPEAQASGRPRSGSSKFFAYSGLAAAWFFFLPYLWCLYQFTDYLPALFALLVPFTLAFYVFHETLHENNGSYWALIPFFLAGGVALLSWEDMEKSGIAALLLEWALCFCALRVADLFFERLAAEVEAGRDAMEKAARRIKTISQENAFYAAKVPELKIQIGAKQELSSFAKEMGTLLDPAKIQRRLMEKIQGLFPGDKVELHDSLFEQDAVNRWILDTKSSLLVKNAGTDKRLLEAGEAAATAYKSLIASPLLSERNLIGLVRVESPTENRFEKTDLQQLELYTHLAILALENAQLFAKVNTMATKDGLTGLATHRVFQEKLAEEILRAARYHKNLVLIMADIDHFKRANDEHGHLAGDKVLMEVSRILMEQCREIDFAARYGGEEFCLILPEISLEEGRGKAELIRRKIEQNLVHTDTGSFRVTASFGCSSFPLDALTAAQLVRKADERLYRAKTGGRNRVVSGD